MLCLKTLVLVLSLTTTAVEAGTVADYIGSRWRAFREMLAAPWMRYFYYPERAEVALPSPQQGVETQEVLFRTTDDVRLHGRFYQSTAPARGTIVQFHGNAGNITHHIGLLLWLVEHGYNLFVFDYRGYGRSAAQPSPSGLYQDALAALRETERLHRTYAPEGNLIVVGQSLGGAVVLKALEDFPASLPIALLVLDSTFASYRNIAMQVTSASFASILLTPLAWLFISDAYAADLQSCRYRLLVLHARADPTVPFSCGERLYREAATPDKDFWVDDAAQHILLTPERPDIQQRFLQLLKELSG